MLLPDGLGPCVSKSLNLSQNGYSEEGTAQQGLKIGAASMPQVISCFTLSAGLTTGSL